MLPIALNHMTVARLNYTQFLDVAAELGCVGVEVRNDLPQPLFDGLDPTAAGQKAQKLGLEILAVAEVKQFNNWSEEKRREAENLMLIAQAAGAKSISLIPRNDGLGTADGERQANLQLALQELKPMLETYKLNGLIEPLGFEISSLRNKSEAVEAIENVGGGGCFSIVHDTFHHHLAGGGPVFPDHTGIIHISGVTQRSLVVLRMADEHRVLVDKDDRLGNIEQIAALTSGGFSGAISFEAFSEKVHALDNPKAELSRSIEYIRSQLAQLAA